MWGSRFKKPGEQARGQKNKTLLVDVIRVHLGHLIQAFLQDAAGAADVQAHIALGLLAVVCTVANGQAVLLGEDLGQLIAGLAKAGHIQPHQERALVGGDLDLGHLFFHKLADDLSAALEVLALLVHPLVAVGVSGFHGGERQVGGAKHPAAVVSVLDLLLELCIGDDHAGGTQTGHVERLADGGVDHQLVVDLGKLARGGAGTGEARFP